MIDLQVSGNAYEQANPGTTIEFELPHPGGRVNLSVYDVRGRTVRTLIDNELEPGCHEVYWDGRNEYGENVSSGIYIILFRCGEFTQEQKILLLK